MDFKKLLEQVLKNDDLLQNAIQSIKESAPSFKDLLKGEFKDKFDTLVKGLATFIVIFGEKCMKEYNMTEEEVVDSLADWLDDQIKIPGVIGLFLEPFDDDVFRYIININIKYIKTKVQVTDTIPVVATYKRIYDVITNYS